MRADFPEDFESFYRREYRQMVGLAYALCQNRWTAEELAQEALIRAHKHWDEVSRYDVPAAWVRRVLTNISTSFLRRRLVEARAMLKLATRAAAPLAELEDREFWRAVRSLPRRQSQVLCLHYLEGRSVAEIATILGCAEGTVKAHMHKARAALARSLGLGGGDTS